MVLIDKKFNEKLLLLETIFPEMCIERDIRKKVISMGLKPHLKKGPGEGKRGFNMLFTTSFSNSFHTFARSFCNFFFLICLEPILYRKFSIFNL